MFIPAFIFGTLSAFFAVIFEIIALDLSHIHDYSSVTLALSSLALLMAVALIEEGAKYLFLRQYLFRYFETVTLTLGQSLPLGLGFGFGFSAIEAAVILSGDFQTESALGLISIFLVHILTTFILVTFLRYPHKRLATAFFFPLFLAILAHFSYDTFVSLVL
jgi:RsiW-degrading membrane proteinase PrsW (M82 family)